MELEEIASQIKLKYSDIFDNIFVEDGTIVCEEYYTDNDCKNDDDCCDKARSNGEILIEVFKMLEISDYYCHRHKYAIVELKLKQEQKEKLYTSQEVKLITNLLLQDIIKEWIGTKFQKSLISILKERM